MLKSLPTDQGFCGFPQPIQHIEHTLKLKACVNSTDQPFFQVTVYLQCVLYGCGPCPYLTPIFTATLTMWHLFQELITGGSCFWVQDSYYLSQLPNSVTIPSSITSVGSHLEHVLLFSSWYM